MKRVLATVAAIVGTAGLVLLFSGAGGHSSGYKVDALFDNVAYLTPGQDVRIAGAKVGTVTKIKLTPQRKARVEMSVSGDWAPFHADADCTIIPQSLIGERYVNCTPGTPSAAALRSVGGQHPTVPLANTHSPVDLDLVLSTFDLPTRERGAILLDALGAGLAGHGSDVNAAILRANPALQETRRVLQTLYANRHELQDLISTSNTVLAALARQKGRVADFVKQSANLVTATAEHRAALSESIARLPALLAQAKPTLAQLDSFAKIGTPAAQQLDAAAPGLTSLLHQLQRFAPDAKPTISALGRTADVTLRALPDVAPQVHRLRAFAQYAKPAGDLVAQLFDSLRSSGSVEGLQNFAYFATAATARYDTVSHMLPAYLLNLPCQLWAVTPSAACNAHFSSQAATTGLPSTATSRAKRSGSSRSQRGGAAPAGSSPAAPPLTTATPPSVTTATPPTTTNPAPPANPVTSLLRYLLG